MFSLAITIKHAARSNQLAMAKAMIKRRVADAKFGEIEEADLVISDEPGVLLGALLNGKAAMQLICHQDNVRPAVDIAARFPQLEIFRWAKAADDHFGDLQAMVAAVVEVAKSATEPAATRSSTKKAVRKQDRGGKGAPIVDKEDAEAIDDADEKEKDINELGSADETEEVEQPQGFPISKVSDSGEEEDEDDEEEDARDPGEDDPGDGYPNRNFEDLADPTGTRYSESAE